jgi:Flp pilus assembly protein TadD
MAQFETVLKLRPDDSDAHNNLAWCLLQNGQQNQAIVHFQRAVELRPDFAEAHSNLGFVLLQRGRAREAMAHFETALKLQPDNARTLSGLAWVLATCPEASVRDGTRALKLAQHANQLTDDQDLLALRALAAASAETGQFTEALTTARRALQLAGTQSNATLADMLRSEINLYQTGSPFRDISLTNGDSKSTRP